MEKIITKRASTLLIFGGSAGSLEVILKILSGLAIQEKSISIIIVLHRKNTEGSLLTNVLSLRTKIPVKEAEDKDIIEPGKIYLAPGDYHLLVEADKSLSLDVSEKVNFSRPSIDVTFEAAAEVYGGHCICILLSGASGDGAKGLKSAKDHGAVVWVQNPDSAEVPYMPESALQVINPDQILTPEEMIKAISVL